MKAVGKAVAVETVERAGAVRPMLGQRLAAASIDLVAGPPSIGRANLEAGCEDDAVYLVSHTVEHQPGFSNPIDAAAKGVHQLHVRPVEGRQVVIVEGWPLAELAIPGLQRCRRHRVMNGRID